MTSRRSFIKKSGTASFALGLGVNSVLGNSENFSSQTLFDDLTKGLPDLVDDDYINRQNTARKWLNKLNIDALYVEGGVNMKYFMDTSWWMSERVFGFVLSADKDPIWVCPAFELKRAKELIKFGKDIRTWEEHESPYKLFEGIMKDIGKPAGKLGIGPNVRNFVSEGIRKDTKINLVNGAPVSENTRAIKTEKELQYMDVANTITKLAYRDAFAQIKEGMSRGDLGKLIRDAHSNYGVSGGASALFGAASAFPHGTKEQRPLKEGDIILVDGGCSVKGYRSDVSRTIVFGKANNKQKEVFEVVKEAHASAFSIIKKGLACREADLAARKVVEKAGYGTGYKTFAHRLGHGIGMEGHEFPYLVNSNTLKMTPGMTFTNEPGIYLYGEFGVRIEDSFAVTENGYHVFGEMLSTSIETPFG